MQKERPITNKKPMRKRVWFTMRSGKVIKMIARDLDLKSTDGKITSYTWDGMPVRSWWFWRRRLLYLDPAEIAAVEVRGG